MSDKEFTCKVNPASHIRTEVPRRDTADHEVFLSFDSDLDAIMFEEWLNDPDTLSSFGRYHDTHKWDYEELMPFKEVQEMKAKSQQ